MKQNNFDQSHGRALTWVIVLLLVAVVAGYLLHRSGTSVPFLESRLSLDTPRLVSTGTETMAAAPFPSGAGESALIAFTNVAGEGVMIRYPDGSIWRAFEGKIAERFLAWSPDQRYLAFRSEAEPVTLPRSFSLLVADVDQRGIEKVTDYLPGLGRPSWRILPGEEARLDIEVYAPSNQGIVRRRYPSLVSPLGAAAPLVYERDGDIWVERDDGEAWQVSRGGGYAPQLSPDGAQVLYQWGDHIFVASLTETAAAAPRRPTAAGIFPVWSPDGQKIAFARMKDDGHDASIECDLFYFDLLHADRPPTQLTFSPAEIEHEISWADPNEIMYSVRNDGSIRRARIR